MPLVVVLWVGLLALMRAVPPVPRAWHPIAHWEPYVFANSARGVRKTARRYRRGNRRQDFDVNWTRDLIPINEHWGEIHKDGFLWVVVRKGRVFGREIRERHHYAPGTRWDHLDWSAASLLRTKKRGGYRPRSMLEVFGQCARVAVDPFVELKGCALFHEHGAAMAARMMWYAEHAGVHPKIMTLPNDFLGPWQDRLRPFHDAGFPTILIRTRTVDPQWSDIVTYHRA